MSTKEPPLVSSVVIHIEGAHEAVNVWLRGAHVGKLLVGKGQGEALRNLLLLEHSRVGRGIIEGERHCDEWLIKDFNVLYRVTRDLLLCVGAGDESTTARALNAVASQLERLRPAYTLTEGVRSAARETGTIHPPSSEALANYEATKKAGEGD